METYTTADGDMLDDICERHYGFHKGTVEAVFAANQNLAAMPPVLPAGIVITLPEITAARDDVIRLFD
ncbi:MAG: tail protein X [Roseitalea sp.]|nr:tail protein X [Roseitalea sp.]MBO6950971.1 tail protein X [Rhizobiaceae bacterium]MBO6591042.1 tail protein X [Roseitalea sp.]MBO6599700.1 tail protein X [Roseitalea sp.]MBO6611456.1 tail protein X [Roseitalea sp.]